MRTIWVFINELILQNISTSCRRRRWRLQRRKRFWRRFRCSRWRRRCGSCRRPESWPPRWECWGIARRSSCGGGGGGGWFRGGWVSWPPWRESRPPFWGPPPPPCSCVCASGRKDFAFCLGCFDARQFFNAELETVVASQVGDSACTATVIFVAVKRVRKLAPYVRWTCTSILWNGCKKYFLTLFFLGLSWILRKIYLSSLFKVLKNVWKNLK